MRSVLLALVVMMVFVVPRAPQARAALLITQITANPPGANAGRQWIEIENTGPDAITLGAKTIRLLTTSGNHLIKAYASGTTTLAADASAVIAENPLSFLHDVPSYTGMLLKSSFTLPLSGIVGIVETDGTVLVEKSYVVPPDAKPVATSKSTSRQATKTTKSTKSHLSGKSSSYGNGTVAPAASADADAAGPRSCYRPHSNHLRAK